MEMSRMLGSTIWTREGNLSYETVSLETASTSRIPASMKTTRGFVLGFGGFYDTSRFGKHLLPMRGEKGFLFDNAAFSWRMDKGGFADGDPCMVGKPSRAKDQNIAFVDVPGIDGKTDISLVFGLARKLYAVFGVAKADKA